MGILVQNEWRNRAIFAMIILMLACLFVSRAFLSISLIAFIVLTTLHSQVYTQLKQFLASPLLISISLLFLLPFISGLWSEDKQEWGKVLLVKLPFLLLPIAFAGQWRLKEKEWQIIARSFLLFTTLACCWSIGQYLLDMQSINESYLRAKTIPTPLDDDHVRFSWLVCLAVITALLLWDIFSGKYRAVWLTLLIIPVIYLHILSARTGLLMLYVFGLAFALYKAKQKPGISLLVIGGLIIFLLIGWFCFPTFQNRIRYNLYDLSFVIKNKYMSGTSDGNRLVSLKAGWEIIKKNPLLGVGAGDLKNEAGQWYDEHVTGIKETDKLYPSSEWIVYGGMVGWPGIILFTVIVFLPLCIKNIPHRFFWNLLHTVAIMGFLIETSLETQYGVFIYVFFVLWWWKWFGVCGGTSSVKSD
ncbi:MAG TPA: O-antigen ligase family protein [Chitinophagaceae bacterium]|nr:O-antigen ligase family protein [Chitinophagaceae bacterium]